MGTGTELSLALIRISFKKNSELFQLVRSSCLGLLKTSDPPKFSDWGLKNSIPSSISSIQSFKKYYLFINNIQQSSSSTLNILSLSFSHLISSYNGFYEGRCYELLPLLVSSSLHLLTLYRSLICTCMEYASNVWRGSIHTTLLNWMKSKA